MAGEKGICAERSRGLAAEFRICAELLGCDFLDAAPYVSMNTIDYMHLNRESHGQLAEKLAEIIRKKVGNE